MNKDKIIRELSELMEADKLIERQIKETSLLETLKGEQELSVYDNRMANGGTGCFHITLNNLMQWLIDQSSKKNPAIAVDILDKYLTIPDTPAYQVIVISGIEVERSVELGNGIMLVPFSSLPDTQAKNWSNPGLMCQKQPFSPAAARLLKQVPKAALLCKTNFSPKFFEYKKDKEPWDNLPGFKSREKELLEACFCITLVGQCTPLPIASYVAAEDWIPCSERYGNSISSFHYDVWNDEIYLFQESDYQKANEIYKKYLQLPSDDKSKLIISIFRLNQAIRRKNIVDKAIDLGIALEAILLDEKSKEQLSFTFRLRGAWLMGDSAEDREEKIKLFKKIYEYRSQAVHNGRLKDKGAEKLLEEGILLCNQSILRILSDGRFPDWDMLVLGS